MLKVKAIAKFILDKVIHEPLVMRAAIIAVIDLAVVMGLVPPVVSDEAKPLIDGAIIAITNVYLLFDARSKVTPAPQTA